MKKISVLLVEDDPSIKDIVKYNLDSLKFNFHACEKSEEALEFCDTNLPDIIIIDWMLPGMSGISLSKTLRKRKDTFEIPLIMLTARSDEEDRIKGFEAGIDDYIIKPFSPKELKARIKAVLRRTNPSFYSKKLIYEDIELNLFTHKATRNKILLNLSPKEFQLLQHFIERPKQIFSREQLLDKLWGRDIFIEIRTIDVHIRRLRKAINLNGLSKKIRTVRSIGYTLD